MYSNTVCEITAQCDNRSYMTSLGKSKDKIKILLDETSWMNPCFKSIENKLRCQVVNLGLTKDTYPKCPNCGALVGNGRGDSFKAKFCSDKCSKEFGRLPIDTKEKLNDYNWLYQQRITFKKAYHEIAAMLNCSTEPITDACKKLNIPHVRYNEANSDTIELLSNYDWLYNHHIVQRLKVREIGKMINSSPSLVSTWLKNHNIEANKINSYERKINKVSKQEKEIGEFIQSLGFKVNHSNRSILEGQEIDITIDETNICFEYNGLYSHHHEKLNTDGNCIINKTKSYHLDKTLKAKEKKYDLFHIWSDEWEQKQEIVKSMIMSKLKKLPIKIYARQCNIVILPSGEKSSFMRMNHIQGNCKSSINYSLQYNNEIVACITLKPTKTNNCSWELVRFACKTNTSVVGGFSKLLSYFRKIHTGSIISYADICYSNGDVYFKNGFKLDHINPPQYWYTLNFDIRLHRANFMKKKISSGDNDKRTEREIMLDNGYAKIYGCGTQAWILE